MLSHTTRKTIALISQHGTRSEPESSTRRISDAQLEKKFPAGSEMICIWRTARRSAAMRSLNHVGRSTLRQAAEDAVQRMVGHVYSAALACEQPQGRTHTC